MQFFTLKTALNFLFSIILLLGSLLTACDDRQPLLNSERIQQRYGNYGVEVLKSGDGLRISNLYSEKSGVRTCRTYAVVEFAAPIHPSVAVVHAEIESGKSIGATLHQAGWTINKRLKYIGEMSVSDADAGLVALMRIEVPQTVALHQYDFEISRDGTTLDYASIMEIHHPDYLSAADLTSIYGVPADGLPAPAVPGL